MTNHPNRKALRGTSLYYVTTPVRRDPSERWTDDSTTIRAYNSAQAIQTARSRLRRFGFELGISSTTKDTTSIS